ncbi:alpha/beta fold hydrolase [Caldimonas sp. KR1-144]|uniref:alpha/beta fold hydrolase n=1 Tax=Caldimonas sp. KR1-144 TaxID=3400911 RepID=UPI003C0DC88E
MSTHAEPRLNHVNCLDASGLHRMAYWEWGDAANPRVLVCVHGLARQGRDFDTLARALSAEWRVVCPDVVGRGRSDRLRDPMGYALPTYVADMVTLLARLGADEVDWVGTSMGGLIGLGVASLRDVRGRSPVRRLVLNDVGPSIRADALARIGSYLGQPVRFASVEEGAAHLRGISQSFGPHTDEQWLRFSEPQLVRIDGEAFGLHYDPGIAVPFRLVTPPVAAAGEAQLWARYDALTCPTLLIRGAESDLLSHETAQAMTQRGPRAELVELPGIGHAPTLIADDQVALVGAFLRRASP